MRKGKYYFFGAGQNCYSALAFWGTDDIKAIVDTDPTKIGGEIQDVPIISINELRSNWNGEWVIVTAYIKSKEIVALLNEMGITKHYVSKPMMSGFMTVEQMIQKWKLLEYKELCFLGDELIRCKLYEKIGKKNADIRLLEFVQEINDEKNAAVIIMEGFEEKYHGVAKIIHFEESIEKFYKNKYQIIRKYQGIHQNQKCLIIGNGPSLRVSDLEMIQGKDITTFGCNRINLLFDQTKWRPDYYVAIDSYTIEGNRENIEQLDMPCFINDLFGMPKFKNEHIVYFRKFLEDYLPGYPSFSSDASQCVYSGSSVTYCMMQIAAYMGFKEIYLLGVDFSFGENGEDAHFYVMEQDDKRAKGDVILKEIVKRGYLSAKNYSESNHIKIYNATRGGNLNVFERKSYDELVSELSLKNR